MAGLSAGLAAVVAVQFVLVAVEDARTGRVSVRAAQRITAVAIGGFGIVGLVTAAWTSLIQAALGAAVITGIQLVPYLLQGRGSRSTSGGGDGRRAWIGRADVRLAVPFGWTLGWFGLGFAFAGFASALLAGLVASAVSRSDRIPFVPFLAVGLIIGLLWALARAWLVRG